jgi:hypothetical protein
MTGRFKSRKAHLMKIKLGFMQFFSLTVRRVKSVQRQVLFFFFREDNKLGKTNQSSMGTMLANCYLSICQQKPPCSNAVIATQAARVPKEA